MSDLFDNILPHFYSFLLSDALLLFLLLFSFFDIGLIPCRGLFLLFGLELDGMLLFDLFFRLLRLRVVVPGLSGIFLLFFYLVILCVALCLLTVQPFSVYAQFRCTEPGLILGKLFLLDKHALEHIHHILLYIRLHILLRQLGHGPLVAVLLSGGLRL